MSDIFQIEQAENQKSSSCTGEVEFSVDGGKTYHMLVAGCMLDIVWSGEDNFGGALDELRPIECSVGYIVGCEGNVSFMRAQPAMWLDCGPSTGIVNHRDAEDFSGCSYTFGVDASESMERMVDALEHHIGAKPAQILIGASPHIALCINALKKEHYAYLDSTGGHTGKGKKAHKRMHRKMFGGW